jgi:coenzyme F420 hydrogenase subunit beta
MSEITYGKLVDEVISQRLCSLCGACRASCPVHVIDWKDEDTISFDWRRCTACKICYYVCPNVSFQVGEIEQKIFGRQSTANEPIGIVRNSFAARSTNKEILKVTQDGGVVTSLLSYMLEKQIIDCAVVTRKSLQVPWKPEPTVALSYADLLQAAGSKYTPSPIALALSLAATEYKKRRIAVVGVSCQIRAIRRMQFLPFAKLKIAEPVVFAIGLFCFKSYYYDKLIEGFLKNRRCLDLHQISKMDSKFEIKGGRFIIHVGEEEILNVPVARVAPYGLEACEKCDDFSAKLADISVGGCGTPPGWSTVLIRTENGEHIFNEAIKAGYIESKPLSEVKPGIELVIRLEQKKREIAKA